MSSGALIPEPTRKLSVLVVNAELPQYDRMAGSLRLQRYVELMVAEGHRVTFVARSGYGQERYAQELRDLGVEVHSFDVNRLRGSGWQIQGVGFDFPRLLKRGRFDLAFLSFYYTAEEYLPDIRTFSPATRIIVDTVDVHHVRERRGAELSGDERALAEAERTRAREAAIYSQADLLVAVSENDRHELRQLAPDVQVEVMSTVHVDAPAGPGFGERSGLLFVGNFMHAPNVDAILDFHQNCWPLVAEALPDARLTIVGNAPPPEVWALNGGRVKVTGHVPEVQPFLDAASISIAPLRFGAGVKGKIGEALTHGVPVVTTPIGAEGMDLHDGESALIADSGEEFAAAIIRLCGDRALWEHISEQGRAHIAQRQSYAASLASLQRAFSLAAPTCFVARASQWTAEAVDGIVAGYLSAFAETDPVSLIVPVTPTASGAEPDCEAVGAMFLDALTRLGADPEHIPDIAVMASAADPPLPSRAVLVQASPIDEAEPAAWPSLPPDAPAITAPADASRWVAAASGLHAPVGARPLISIIVPAYNKRQITETCLTALDRDLGDRIGKDVQLVLVNNGSTDSTAELFTEWSSRATVVTLPQNRNFAGGANAGARAARGDVLVLVTNDVEVGPGAVDALVEEVLQPGVGLVGARLRYPNGRLQHGGFGWRPVPGGVVPFHLFHSESGSLPAARATVEIGAVTGACSAFRADLFRLVGGYDEGYVNGWEDIDLCLAIQTTGATIRYRGDVDIVHHEGVTAGGRYNEEGNPRRFFTRWGDMLWDDSSLLRHAFGASVSPLIDLPDPGRLQHGAPVLLVGPVAGIGPESDEARGLLRALQKDGGDIAARTVDPTWIGPSVDELRWRELANAHARAAHPDATTIVIGDYHAGVTAGAHVLRIGAEVASRPAGAVAWVASPAVRDELLRRGWPEEAIEVVAPAGIESSLGSGGQGVLVIAPTHNRRLTAELLEALRHVHGATIRLLPTVRTPSIHKALRDAVPGAELLAPTTDERAVASLAAESDLVVAVDPDDAFDRIALTAAAAGAPVAIRAGGPAAWVLGTAAIVSDPADPGFVARILGRQDYDTAPSGRRARATTVLKHCGAHATVEALRRLPAVARAA